MCVYKFETSDSLPPWSEENRPPMPNRFFDNRFLVSPNLTELSTREVQHLADIEERFDGMIIDLGLMEMLDLAFEDAWGSAAKERVAIRIDKLLNSAHKQNIITVTKAIDLDSVADDVLAAKWPVATITGLQEVRYSVHPFVSVLMITILENTWLLDFLTEGWYVHETERVQNFLQRIFGSDKLFKVIYKPEDVYPYPPPMTNSWSQPMSWFDWIHRILPFDRIWCHDNEALYFQRHLRTLPPVNSGKPICPIGENVQAELLADDIIAKLLEKRGISAEGLNVVHQAIELFHDPITTFSTRPLPTHYGQKWAAVGTLHLFVIFRLRIKLNLKSTKLYREDEVEVVSETAEFLAEKTYYGCEWDDNLFKVGKPWVMFKAADVKSGQFGSVFHIWIRDSISYSGRHPAQVRRYPIKISHPTRWNKFTVDLTVKGETQSWQKKNSSKPEVLYAETAGDAAKRMRSWMVDQGWALGFSPIVWGDVRDLTMIFARLWCSEHAKRSVSALCEAVVAHKNEKPAGSTASFQQPNVSSIIQTHWNQFYQGTTASVAELISVITGMFKTWPFHNRFSSNHIWLPTDQQMALPWVQKGIENHIGLTDKSEDVVVMWTGERYKFNVTVMQSLSKLGGNSMKHGLAWLTDVFLPPALTIDIRPWCAYIDRTAHMMFRSGFERLGAMLSECTDRWPTGRTRLQANNPARDRDHSQGGLSRHDSLEISGMGDQEFLVILKPGEQQLGLEVFHSPDLPVYLAYEDVTVEALIEEQSMIQKFAKISFEIGSKLTPEVLFSLFQKMAISLIENREHNRLSVADVELLHNLEKASWEKIRAQAFVAPEPSRDTREAYIVVDCRPLNVATSVDKRFLNCAFQLQRLFKNKTGPASDVLYTEDKVAVRLMAVCHTQHPIVSKLVLWSDQQKKKHSQLGALMRDIYNLPLEVPPSRGKMSSGGSGILPTHRRAVLRVKFELALHLSMLIQARRRKQKEPITDDKLIEELDYDIILSWNEDQMKLTMHTFNEFGPPDVKTIPPDSPTHRNY